MKYLRNGIFGLLLIASQSLFAASGLLFDVSATGTAGSANVTLCLNGVGAISCQSYDLNALSLNICAVPNHQYSSAGIKVNTAGYTIANSGVDCVPYSNGYCLFSVSQEACKSISLSGGTLVSISPSSLPAAVQNTAYSQTVTASGGVSPYIYTVTSGSLPTGLSLNSSTGLISGDATTIAIYPFTITATDANSSTGSRDYSITVAGSACGLGTSGATLTAATDGPISFTGTGFITGLGYTSGDTTVTFCSTLGDCSQEWFGPEVGGIPVTSITDTLITSTSSYGPTCKSICNAAGTVCTNGVVATS